MKMEFPKTEERALGPSSANSSFAEEIPSNKYVVGNKNSQFLYDQESEGPYQEMSKGASLNNRYLQKIAEEKKKPGLADVAGAYAVGGLVATPVAVAASKLGLKMLKEDVPKNGSSDLGTVKKMMRDNNLNVTFKDSAHHVSENMKHAGNFQKEIVHAPLNDLRHMINPAYVPAASTLGGTKDIISGVRDTGEFSAKTGTVNRSVMKNKDLIMHELGHAKDFARHGRAKHIVQAIGTKGRIPLGFAALSNDKTRDYAPAIVAATTLPSLRSEAAANYHAYQGIKAHKGAAAANSFLKKLVTKNTANYWGIAGSQVLAAYAGKKILDHQYGKTK